MYRSYEPEDDYEFEVEFECEECGYENKTEVCVYVGTEEVELDCEKCGEKNSVDVTPDIPCRCGSRCYC